jgi:CheY-like chemotaxis protein
LQQVLLNLCVNARDAMPEGGRLSVRASNLVLDAESAAQILDARAGRYVHLVVEDTGTGIAPELLEKIFDPFFTTKPPGKGTGLGLSTTLAIVKGHGGFLRVHSDAGAGTRVDVYLPATTEVTGDPDIDAGIDPPRGDGETVLVVDDEAAIRATTRDLLEAHGYRVLEAEHGADAIRLFAAHQREIAVVITDLMMPVMDGPATIQVLHQLAPRVPVIAVSGMAASREARLAVEQGAAAFLAKPCTAFAILATVARVLRERRTPDAAEP